VLGHGLKKSGFVGGLKKKSILVGQIYCCCGLRMVHSAGDSVVWLRTGQGLKARALWTISGTAAEVSTQLVVLFGGCGDVSSVTGLGQRHGKTRRAVSTLTARIVDQGGGNGMRGICEVLCCENGTTMEAGDEDKAGVYGSRRGTTLGEWVDDDDATSTTVTFGTAFFCGSEAPLFPQPIE
jgi:hypothetical protein